MRDEPNTAVLTASIPMMLAIMPSTYHKLNSKITNLCCHLKNRSQTWHREFEACLAANFRLIRRLQVSRNSPETSSRTDLLLARLPSTKKPYLALFVMSWPWKYYALSSNRSKRCYHHTSNEFRHRICAWLAEVFDLL